MRYVLIISMLFAMCLAAFAENGHEIIFGGTVAYGVSPTDTRLKPLSKMNVDFYPGGKNIGISYDLGYRHAKFFTMKPFTADHSELTHSFALVVRLRDEGRFQPTIRAGAMRFLGHTRVRRFGETLIDANDGKFMPMVSLRVNIRVWKHLMLVPEVEASDFPRPAYNAGVGIAYNFNFGRK